jgi:hypothetical protein
MTLVTQLTASSAITSDDLFIVVDDPAGSAKTKKATAQQVLEFVEQSSSLGTRVSALEQYDQETVHVDAVNGVDQVGGGTLLKPFKTINYAYSQVPSCANPLNTLYTTGSLSVQTFVTEKLIFKLAPGTYTENVVLGFKRARVALVGNGARIVGTVKMDVKKADFPASSLQSTTMKAAYPAPWTGFSAQMSFEIAGDAGGGLEADSTTSIITVTGRTSIEFENGGASYNWDTQYGQFYVSSDNAALIGGLVMIHDNTVATARAPAVVFEVESSKIGNADSGARTYCGYIPFGANTTIPSFGSLTLKAHNSTFASVIGPSMILGELDGCRVYDIDRTMSGSVTNGGVGGSPSTSYVGIVNTQFRNMGGVQGNSLYRIGQASGTRYKMDSVSYTTLAFSRNSSGVLSARTLDVTGTLNYDFLDDARSQFVGFTPANYTVSGTISSTQGHLAGIDTAVGLKEPAVSTMQTLIIAGNITTAPVPNVVLLSGSAINATLPLASSNAGRRIVIKKTNSLAADTVSARDGETIDGSATRTLNALERVTLLASGSTWFVI